MKMQTLDLVHWDAMMSGARLGQWEVDTSSSHSSEKTHGLNCVGGKQAIKMSAVVYALRLQLQLP